MKLFHSHPLKYKLKSKGVLDYPKVTSILIQFDTTSTYQLFYALVIKCYQQLYCLSLKPSRQIVTLLDILL